MAADRSTASCAVDRRLNEIEDAIVSMALRLGIPANGALTQIMQRVETRLADPRSQPREAS